MSIIMVDTELVLDTMKAYDNYVYMIVYYTDTMKAYDNYVYNNGWYWIGLGYDESLW